MLRLNEDVLSLVIKELQNYVGSLFSCILVNKIWCVITVPILWKNPWEYFKFDDILLHLSEESRNILKNEEIDLFTEKYQKPLFNYISFCKYLDLQNLEFMIDSSKFHIKKSKISILKNELYKLFINENTKYTHLYTPVKFNYQIQNISGAEYCFSELKSFQCFICIDQNILKGLTRISKLIEKLEIYINRKSIDNFAEIIEFIEVQKNLNDFSFCSGPIRESELHKTLEESLIKHATNIKYLQIDWKPTKVLSYLVNLVSLEMSLDHYAYWNQPLKSVSLPTLKILKTYEIPSGILNILIENTKGHLNEIEYYSITGVDDTSLTQTICQNCSNLRYLSLSINNYDLQDLEKILNNCQNLEGLIIIDVTLNAYGLYWNCLFEILVKSAPDSLYKFKFGIGNFKIELKIFKKFFDNWKVRCRHPMLLFIIIDGNLLDYDFFKKYEAEGIIKKFNIVKDLCFSDFENFEWIQKKNGFTFIPHHK